MIIVSVVSQHGVYLHISTENNGGRRRFNGECFARQISLTLWTFQKDRINFPVHHGKLIRWKIWELCFKELIYGLNKIIFSCVQSPWVIYNNSLVGVTLDDSTSNRLDPILSLHPSEVVFVGHRSRHVCPFYLLWWTKNICFLF